MSARRTVRGDKTRSIRAQLVRWRWFCRSRPVLWWLVSVIALGGALWVWHQQVSALAAQRALLVQPRSVLVAKRNLSRGTVIGPDDLHADTRPEAFVPDDALPATTAVIGAVVREPILAGEALVRSRVGAGSGIEALLEPSERAVAIANRELGLPVELGTLVDVVATPVAATASDDEAPKVLVASARVVGLVDRAVVVAVPAQALPSVAEAVAREQVVLAVSGDPPRRR